MRLCVRARVCVHYSVNSQNVKAVTSTAYVVDYDECSSHPCQNGGTCSTPDFNMFSCQCAPGYTGTNCETGMFETPKNVGNYSTQRKHMIFYKFILILYTI